MRSQVPIRILILLCMAILFAGIAPRAAADDDDDPSSRVARLSYAQGSVSFQPAGTDDWVTAVLNRPITTGDQIWTDRDGRLELQLDGSLIRLSNNTGFSFLNLSDNVTQIQLTSGTLLVRVRRIDPDETYEIDTPNLAFSIHSLGLYRISVNDSGDSTAIKIRSGEGEVTGEGAGYTLGGNDSYTFSGADQLYANPAITGITKISLTGGRLIAIDDGRVPSRHNTFRLTSSAMKIWTITDSGNRQANTATSGSRALPLRTGLLSLRTLGVYRALGIHVGG